MATNASLHVALVIDVFARKIMGWRVSTPMPTQFAPDAPNQAIFQRKAHRDSDLIHHPDRGSQCLSITCTERLAETGIDPSVGTIGDSHDNAPAESVIGLFRTEAIDALGPWRTLRDVEWQALKWIDRYNNRRFPAFSGHVPPVEAENACFAKPKTLDQAA